MRHHLFLSSKVNILQAYITKFPTEHFTTLEPYRPSLDVFKLQTVHVSPDFEALKL